jgi:hypothetical protein
MISAIWLSFVIIFCSKAFGASIILHYDTLSIFIIYAATSLLRIFSIIGRSIGYASFLQRKTNSCDRIPLQGFCGFSVQKRQKLCERLSSVACSVALVFS